MSYKVLDLRVGEFFKQSDIFFETNKDAIYYEISDAEDAIRFTINRFQPSKYHPKLIPEYFEIIKCNEPATVYSLDSGMF